MSWGNEPDSNEERRKFRDRWQSDEDAYSAADAEDQYDDGSDHDLSFGEHAAGLDRDQQYDGRYSAPYNPPQENWQSNYPTQPPQQYPPQNQPPYSPQYPPQNQPPYPPQYGQQPPQQPYPPQYGQQPPQQYPPQNQPPQYGQQPPQPQYYGQQPPQQPTENLPDRAQRLQNRLNNLSTPQQPAAISSKSEPEDGIERLMSGKLDMPNPMMIGIFLLLMTTMVCVMGILALGSLDRHLGLGIF